MYHFMFSVTVQTESVTLPATVYPNNGKVVLLVIAVQLVLPVFLLPLSTEDKLLIN